MENKSLILKILYHKIEVRTGPVNGKVQGRCLFVSVLFPDRDGNTHGRAPTRTRARAHVSWDI